MAADKRNGDDDCTTNDCKDREDVAKHSEEAEKHHGIEANLVYQVCFLDGYGVKPSKQLPSQARRRVLFVGVFRSRGIHMVDAGAEETKGHEQASGHGKGPDERRIYGICLDLRSVNDEIWERTVWQRTWE